MAEEWLSIAEVSKQLGLAENTARRYTHLFKEYINSRQLGRAMKYDPKALGILSEVSRLYHDGLSTQEIQERLGGKYALHVEIAPHEAAQAPVALSEIHEAMVTMAEHIKRQEQFNQELLKRLEDREQYIDSSIRSRDEKLVEALREIRESRLLSAAAEEQQSKSWWKWWK